MAASYTYLWAKPTWDRKRSEGPSSEINYASSNLFGSRGVVADDRLFIVTVREGVLYLGGTLKIKKILDKAAAATYLGIAANRLWDAKEFAVADPCSLSPFNYNHTVSPSVSHCLEFIDSKSNIVTPKITNGRLDQQTMRGIRKLNIGSDLLLERLHNSYTAFAP